MKCDKMINGLEDIHEIHSKIQFKMLGVMENVACSLVWLHQCLGMETDSVLITTVPSGRKYKETITLGLG